MSDAHPISLLGWITAVELPLLAGLFWLIWRGKRDADAALDRLGRRIDRGLDEARQALADYKLDVATTYASRAALEHVEERLTAHLLRIEAKLDAKAGAP